MNRLALKQSRRIRRQARVRRTVFGTTERPRLTVFRSLKHIYAQLIDDSSGRTLCAANSRAKGLREQFEKGGGNRVAAALVGQALGERARMQGIRKIVFDRNGYRYHGRVKALAEAARKMGLEF